MNDRSKKYIQYLIRNSVMQVVRTDDYLEQLINNGLLTSVDEVTRLRHLQILH